ncbi:MAG: protein-disulfide reductase DsbD family protein [Verrucomicrobiia bacterium]
MRILFVTILTAFLTLFIEVSHGSESTANLLVNLNSVKKGDEILAGVHIKPPQGWHIYWINPGESGAPPKINWSLPDGFKADNPIFQLPIKHTLGGVTSYVIENETVLIVPIKTAPWLKEGEYILSANVEWLECKELCRPAKAKIQNKIIVGNQNVPSPDSSLITEWLKKTPYLNNYSNIISSAFGTWKKVESGGNKYGFTLEVNSQYPIADFFPYQNEQIDFETSTIVEKAGENRYTIKKNAILMGKTLPSRIDGVVTFLTKTADGREGVEVKNIPVSEIKSGQTGASQQTISSPIKFLTALYLAFLGGIILNFMPCVLPVISLKILSVIKQSTQSPKQVRLTGLVFTSGVVLSLLIFALIVVLIQQAGKLAGWGMQFQSPVFVVLATILVTVIGLNLFGIFEVSLGGSALDKAAGLVSKQGLAGSFFQGALVVILATPCTAPFLGAALGYAFTQPPVKTFAIFFSISIGLSMPYLLISMFPSVSKIFPRPGEWMEKLKIIMGFPMLATAMWLLSVSFSHYGNKAGWVGIYLVVISLALWLFGEFKQRKGKTFSGVIIPIALIASGYLYILEYEIDWRHSVKTDLETVHQSKYGINWLRWSPEAVEKARGEGKVVLVDFTAEWCLTCKANMKTSLDTPAVSEKLKQIGAVTFLADYTLGDEQITEELRKHNRAGVPLVLIYPKNKQSEPIILPEVLTPGIVIEALEKAAQEK